MFKTSNIWKCEGKAMEANVYLKMYYEHSLNYSSNNSEI